jgi:hypothetical protein
MTNGIRADQIKASERPVSRANQGIQSKRSEGIGHGSRNSAYLLLSTLTKVAYACKLMKPNDILREIVGWEFPPA